MGATDGPRGGAAHVAALLEEALAALEHGEVDSPAGSAAALTAALAAALTALAARGMSPDSAAAAAVQAKLLRDRLGALAQLTSGAHRRAVELLDRATAAGARARSPERDRALGGALLEAADVPLAICETAADVVALAAWVAEDGSRAARADAIVAATLAEAAAAGAAELVAVNLAVQPGDERAERARGCAEGAARTRRALGEGWL